MHDAAGSLKFRAGRRRTYLNHTEVTGQSGLFRTSVQTCFFFFFFFLKNILQTVFLTFKWEELNFLRICWFWIQIAIQFQGNDFLGLSFVSPLEGLVLWGIHLPRERGSRLLPQSATPQCLGDWFSVAFSHSSHSLWKAARLFHVWRTSQPQHYWNLGASQLWGCPGLCRIGSSSPGLQSRDASSIPPTVATNISRHCCNVPQVKNTSPRGFSVVAQW